MSGFQSIICYKSRPIFVPECPKLKSSERPYNRQRQPRPCTGRQCQIRFPQSGVGFCFSNTTAAVDRSYLTWHVLAVARRTCLRVRGPNSSGSIQVGPAAQSGSRDQLFSDNSILPASSRLEQPVKEPFKPARQVGAVMGPSPIAVAAAGACNRIRIQRS